ncbi:hypothetical protein HMPREF1986_00239 [Oribacterium sp. oral taxon 078 str. F0263]|nr:hypothetical protein HMPREF1986_00239 [Oribacterium sp. oral taxon 078 str. F0263]
MSDKPGNALPRLWPRCFSQQSAHSACRFQKPKRGRNAEAERAERGPFRKGPGPRNGGLRNKETDDKIINTGSPRGAVMYCTEHATHALVLGMIFVVLHAESGGFLKWQRHISKERSRIVTSEPSDMSITARRL